MKILDINDKVLKNGDIIDIHQTVNGENLFVVLSVDNLDIRYKSNLIREYEYDEAELLSVDKFTGESTFEIVGNIND